MQETETLHSTLPATSRPLLERKLSRRSFLKLAGNAICLVGVLHHEDIEEFLEKVYPNDAFLRNATAISSQELQEMEEAYQEEPLPVTAQPELVTEYMLSCRVQGTGEPGYLTFPPLESETPSLTVFDIAIDNRRLRRTGVVSSPGAREKGVQLGPLSKGEEHTVSIIKRFADKESPFDLSLLKDNLRFSSPVGDYSLQRMIDERAPFIMPRLGEPVWNDIPLETLAIPYTQDERYRILYVKLASAEDSRFRSLFKETGRTYDLDWMMKEELDENGGFINGYVQKRSHKTQQYRSGKFINGTHPLVQVYTENGMVRDTDEYFSQAMPHFADRPRIVSASESNFHSKEHYVNVDAQGVSVSELVREGKIHGDDKIIVDFRQRLAAKYDDPRKSPR